MKTLLLAAILLSVPAFAQQSPSYKIEQSVFNNGGDPLGGSFASSASYRITLDALGEGAIGTGLMSSSFLMESGFMGAYPPPGEVPGMLGFTSNTAISWPSERSVGSYNVYRGLVNTLPGGYGACFQSALDTTSTTDTADPGVGTSFFYLVTAKNRLGEEGTKGYRSSGAERPNPLPCP